MSPRARLEPKFQRVADEVARLKARHEAGEIDTAAVNATLNDLMVEHQGRWWMLGVNSDQWYVHDGGQWIATSAPTTAETARKLPDGHAADLSGPATRHRTGVAGGVGGVPSPKAPTGQWATVTTLAGSGQKGFVDGHAGAARFSRPGGIAFAPGGIIFVADTGNRRIRMILPDGQVETVAGSGRLIDGQTDGPRARATFLSPVALDSDGQAPLNVYVAESAGPIRWIRMADMFVQSFRGGFTGSDGFGALAGLAVAPDGAIYVSDYGGDIPCIYRIKPGELVRRIGGRPPAPGGGYRDGEAHQACFHQPAGLAVDAQGTLYVADSGNHCIRMVDADGQVTTIAGGTKWTGSGGCRDGVGEEAMFRSPLGVAVDRHGRVYVADTGNQCIRRIDIDRRVTTIAGSGKKGLVDGPGSSAQFNAPRDLVVDARGMLYVADEGNHCIRAVQLN